MTKVKDMCNCHSYNWDTGENPNTVLKAPKWLDSRQHEVCIDSCIAPAIKRLWKKRMPTINSCCGHNRLPPSLVVPEGADHREYHRVLAEIDNKKWSIMSWEKKVTGVPLEFYEDGNE